MLQTQERHNHDCFNMEVVICPSMTILITDIYIAGMQALNDDAMFSLELVARHETHRKDLRMFANYDFSFFV